MIVSCTNFFVFPEKELRLLNDSIWDFYAIFHIIF